MTITNLLNRSTFEADYEQVLGNERKWLHCGKSQKQTIMDADYADDIALLANTPARTGSLLYSLEKAADDIGLHINADKTEYM